MKLGEMIEALSKHPVDAKLYIEGAIRCVPTRLDSYRGYYEDLAIGFQSDREAEPTTVGAFLQRLREAEGDVFTGYKGGEYRASLDTLMWVSNYGECGRAFVDSVYSTDEDDVVNIGVQMRWTKPRA